MPDHDDPRPLDCAVWARGLVKYAGHQKVLDDVDFTVRRGEIHVLLGLTESGKSTLLRLLTGLLRPDAGELSVLGDVPWRAAASLHRHLAFAPGEVQMWPGLPVGSAIDLAAQMHGGIDMVTRAQLLALLDLDPTKRGQNCNASERAQIALVAALSSSAELVVLGEPVAPLTITQQFALSDWLAKMRGTGRTIVLAGRHLTHIHDVADTVTVLDHGHAAEYSPDELHHLGFTSIIAGLDRPYPALTTENGVHNVHSWHTVVAADIDNDHLPRVLQRILDHGVHTLTSHTATLDEMLTAGRISFCQRHASAETMADNTRST